MAKYLYEIETPEDSKIAFKGHIEFEKEDLTRAERLLEAYMAMKLAFSCDHAEEAQLQILEDLIFNNWEKSKEALYDSGFNIKIELEKE